MVQVGELMRPPLTVSPRATVVEAARAMQKQGSGWVIVTSGTAPMGVVTERDLLYRAIAARLFTGSTYTVQVMTSRLVVGTPEMTAEEVVGVMSRHGVRMLPVVRDDKLVGAVTLQELLREFGGGPDVRVGEVGPRARAQGSGAVPEKSPARISSPFSRAASLTA